jgi:Mn2+/Fe2+ NRAMP family transporter
MSRLLSILFWSVLAAAFIGPGTVTTAASAGAGFGTSLLWALAFSTTACLVLQEAAGRLTLVSGRSLGQALSEGFPRGGSRLLMLTLVLGAILLGCAAYEAGNILGAVSGALLVFEVPKAALTALCGVIAGLLLWFNAPQRVAQVLGIAVGVMGVAFLAMAVSMAPALPRLLDGLLVPSLPTGAGILALGLVGTTVVPYNLFLGSGLARDQDLATFRFGLGVAVILGGVISMGVLVVGTSVSPPFSFAALADSLRASHGEWAATLFALGLFAAGLSSAITAPLAAALTARGLFAKEDSGPWSNTGARYRMIWVGVLAAGLFFGLSGVRPVPAIILAQAFNGIVLPGVACYLLLEVNNRRLMGEQGLNGWFSNALMTLVVAVAVVLGTVGVTRALSGTLGTEPPGPGRMLTLGILVCALVAVPMVRGVLSRRQAAPRPGA